MTDRSTSPINSDLMHRDIPANTLTQDGMPASLATRFKPSKPENLQRPTGIKPPPPKK